MRNRSSMITVWWWCVAALTLVLMLWPLPSALSPWRPGLLTIVLAHWAIYAPDRIGVFTAWWLGLCQDIVLAAPLGLFALVYSLMVYVILKNHRLLRSIHPLNIALFLAFVQLIYIVGHCCIMPTDHKMLLQLVVTPLAWLFVSPMLHRWRRLSQSG